MKQKIVCKHLFENERMYLLECSSNSRLKKSYVIKQVLLDEFGKPARVIIDFCDTYIDAFFSYRETLDTLMDYHFNHASR